MKQKYINNSAKALRILVLIIGIWLCRIPVILDCIHAGEYAATIPEAYHDEISMACNGIRIDDVREEDLNAIETLSLKIEGADSLRFLGACNNLNTLDLTFSTDDDRYCLDTIPSIPSLTHLTIRAEENIEISFAANNGVFLNNEDNIEYLHLSGIDVGPDAIESLYNLKTLILDTSLNNELDYAAMDLDVLDLSWYGPYDVPIFLSYDNYQTLIENGVDVRFDPTKREDDYIDVWFELSEIAEALNIANTDSEQAIMDRITAYTVERLEFNEMILEKINQGILDEAEIRSFYEGGNLYGALKKDSSICGNYTALIKALAEYYGIASFYVINHEHAWNLVLADGTLGYVDGTSLDLSYDNAADTIREGNGQDLWWYMDDTDIDVWNSIDEREPPLVFPEYMNELCAEQMVIGTEETEVNKQEQYVANNSPKANKATLIILMCSLIGGIIMLLIVLSYMHMKKQTTCYRHPQHAALYWRQRKKKAILGRSAYLIGSKKGAVNLYIENRAVSRAHAVIRWTSEGYHIKDLGSTNGTYINGRFIQNHDVLLHNGDIIKFGTEYFKFTCS